MGVCLIQSCVHNEAFAAAATTQNCVFRNGHMVEECILFFALGSLQQGKRIRRIKHFATVLMVHGSFAHLLWFSHLLSPPPPPPHPTVTSPFPVAEESWGQTGSSPELHMCVL